MLPDQLSKDDNRFLMDRLFSDSIEELIQIDQEGNAITLQASEKNWSDTLNSSYSFDKQIRNYLLTNSADSNTDQILLAMDLDNVREQLKISHTFKVFYTTRNSSGGFCIKKALFLSKDEACDPVFLLISDITEDYEGASVNMNELNQALKNITTELGKRNAFLNLMNRNIRTPLHSIMGLTKIVEENLGRNSSIDSYLHKISMSGTYMSDTIDDILELRRIAAHEITLNPKTVNLQEFLLQIRHIIEPECKDKNLIFSINIDISPNLQVNADPHALHQIVIKLLHSAMNYTVKGGRIQLSVRELFVNDGTVTVDFSAECLGIVIDEDRLKVLFQPYDYLINKMDQDIGSLDMSLIILKSYAMVMGTDTLVAESYAGKGTKVSLSLTMDLSENMTSINKLALEELLPSLKGLRVLLVDDNETNLEVGEKILCSKGMDVVSVQNGEEAVNVYVQYHGHFDLIIMDILMPVMDGLTAAKKIRSMSDIAGAKTVPIIAMTANALCENVEESFRAGMNAHLVKPISPEKLFASIAKVLSNNQNKY